MKRLSTLVALALALTAGMARAANFERPIPEPQTDAAEFWYLIASLALVVALIAVQRLVRQR